MIGSTALHPIAALPKYFPACTCCQGNERRTNKRPRLHKRMREEEKQLNQRRQTPSTGDVLLEDQLEGADRETYTVLLRRCCDSKALFAGTIIHAHLYKTGYIQETFLGNLLVQMYGKCGRPDKARLVFEKMQSRNIFSWNIMITAYAKNGYFQKALDLYQKMEFKGVRPNKITLVCILNVCSSLGALREGKLIHASLIGSEEEFNVMVATSLLDMYGKCGSIEDARSIFDEMQRRDVVAWNAIISAYSQNGYPKESITLFRDMCTNHVKPDSATYVSVVDACSKLGNLGVGKAIHKQIRADQIEGNVVIATALVDMYSKCGDLNQARNLFDRMTVRNVVTWSAMMGGYRQYGHDREALDLFWKIEDSLRLDNVTYAVALQACTTLKAAAAAEGKEIHRKIIHSRIETDPLIAVELVNMYVSCLGFAAAREILLDTGNGNGVGELVYWNGMITRYTQNGYGRKAIELYIEMSSSMGITPDRESYVKVLEACATVGAVTNGASIHMDILATSFNTDIFVLSALINMYSKCGSLHNAEMVFEDAHKENVVLWTSMMAAYSRHNQVNKAFTLFRKMYQMGLKPNKITFTTILEACTKRNLFHEGCRYLESMVQDHSIQPDLHHYMCLIHLLCRSGNLIQAQQVINSMPFVAEVTVWLCLLSGCRIHGNVELGIRVANMLTEMDPDNSLENILADAGRLEELKWLQDLATQIEFSPIARHPSSFPLWRDTP